LCAYKFQSESAPGAHPFWKKEHAYFLKKNLYNVNKGFCQNFV